MSTGVSQEFRSTVADCQAAIDKASFFNNWKPPGSAAGIRYNVLLVGLATGSKPDDEGTPQVWVRLDHKIMDVLDEIPDGGDLRDKEFSVFFSTRPNQIGKLQEFFALVDMVVDGGEFSQSRDLLGAVEALEEYCGHVVCKLRMKTRTWKGTEYANESYEGILDS